LSVTLALTSGTGTLQGTTSLDIGFDAGNGSVTFTGLRIDSAGTKQLTASASGLASAVSAAFNVSQGSQTITFSSLPGRTYGDAPFSLDASASSGLPITFSIVSGPASLSSSNLSITAAGTVVARASQPGNADYTAATGVDQSFAVAKAPLTITADNTNRVYGAANPAFTGSFIGFVNGDNSSALTGSPSLTTSATTASGVAGSPFPIAAANGTLGSANYSFTFIDGQLTITRANTANAVSSSANPSPTGSNVTFTATLTAVSPGSGTPVGTVQFLTDGVSLGSPVTLAGGAATVSTSSLLHGTRTISAQYAGDANFIGSTNSLAPDQAINARPVAANDNLERFKSGGVKVRVATLLANDTDLENDALTFSSVGPVSAAGVTVVAANPWIFYTPSPAFTNSDNFSYVMADSGGLQATGSVSITIAIDAGLSQNVVLIDDLGNNASRVHFQGIPGRVYTIQYTESLVTPDWQPLGTATADSVGRSEFIDTPGNGSPARFYRSTYP
jgi:hypothetical protein